MLRVQHLQQLLGAPQPYWRRAATTKASIAASVRCGDRCGSPRQASKVRLK
jgi:hypothetical protein